MTTSRTAWQRIGRPVVAWVATMTLVAFGGAALLASLAYFGPFAFMMQEVNSGPSDTFFAIGTFASYFFFFGCVLGALPAAVLVSSIRALGALRPFADIVAGALLAAAAATILGLGISPAVAFGAALLAGPSGAAAGFLYWWFAGRPRPPYDLSAATVENLHR